MRITRLFYTLRGRSVPYYADYPLRLIVWKPIRKWLNVVVIPNVVSTRLRVALYRLIGFRIGRNVFIGMKCYMDDIEPSLTTIEDNVVISYGTYFAVHGPGQGHMPITIRENAYLGMRCTVISGRSGVVIGRNAVVAAGATVHKSVPDNAVVAGCPMRIVRIRPDEVRDEAGDARRDDDERKLEHERQQPERGGHRGGVLGQEPRQEFRHGQEMRTEEPL